MSHQTKDILKTFEQIVQEYLTEIEYRNLSDRFVQSVSKEKKLTQHEIFDPNKYMIEDSRFLNLRRFQIDGLITTADAKLDDNTFLDLLLSLAKTASALGEYSLADEIYNLVISRGTQNNNAEAVAFATMGLGEVKAYQAYWKESQDYLRQASTMFVEQKDYRSLAKCENLLGTIAGDQGNFVEAVNHFNRGISFIDQKSDRYLSAILEGNLAIVNTATDKYDIAITNLFRALQSFERIMDFKGIAQARYNIGYLLMRKGDFKEALNEFDGCIEASRKVEYLQKIGLAFLCKSNIYAELDDYSLSLAIADKSMEISLRINDRLTIADLYKIKGKVHRKLRDHNSAEDYLLTSLRLNKELNNDLNTAETSFELGLLYKDMKREADAVQYLTHSLEYNKNIGAEAKVKEIESVLNN